VEFLIAAQGESKFITHASRDTSSFSSSFVVHFSEVKEGKNTMASATPVGFATYSDPNDRRTRLAELGLAAEMLVQAVQRGHSAWANCTLNHPRLFPGISAWAEAVNALRELLIPLGWNRSDEGNLPFTVNEAGNVALCVSTGDEATGRVDESPCTKSSKGPRTANAVAVNQRQLTLFGDIRLQPEDLANVNGRMTWLLLMHRDLRAREVRCELSRPVNMNEDGRVDGWAERIILPVTPIDGDTVEIPDSEISQTPNIVVNVTRRA